jgi:hypothetical protein
MRNHTNDNNRVSKKNCPGSQLTTSLRAMQKFLLPGATGIIGFGLGYLTRSMMEEPKNSAPQARTNPTPAAKPSNASEAQKLRRKIMILFGPPGAGMSNTVLCTFLNCCMTLTVSYCTDFSFNIHATVN